LLGALHELKKLRLILVISPTVFTSSPGIECTEKLLEYSFQFLLDREPNTSILSFFELNIISKYFPEYESEIKNFCTKIEG